MTRAQKQLARLQRRVRALEKTLEQTLAPADQRHQGPRLTEAALKERYETMRSKGVRFVELRIHPDLADRAFAVVNATALRGLHRVSEDPALKFGGWELREIPPLRIRDLGPIAGS